MRIILLLILIPNVLSAQETKKYFTPHFQNETKETTKDIRTYTFKDGYTVIEDEEKGVIVHKATIQGITEMAKVNEFAWYGLQGGYELYHKSYFKNARGVFDFYEKGKRVKQTIVRDNKVKYAQVWDAGVELLTGGNGVYTSVSDSDAGENMYEQYVDSTLVTRYGVRRSQQDTIHYIFDKTANPKEGMPAFYQELVKTLKYPGIARLAGKEGRIYVQFVVDKDGKLTEFKPLTKEGYNFESKAIRKMEKLPNWMPAMFRSRNVKAKFVLPIKFEFKS